MKKEIIFSIVFLFTAVLGLQAQNNPKISDNANYQRIKKFDTTQPIDNAIALFVQDVTKEKEVTFQAKKTYQDQNGNVHQRHQQFFKGIEVEFGVVITHSNNGKVYSINGEVYDVSGLNMTPALSKQESFQSALVNIKADKYLWEDSIQSQILNYKKPEGELIIFPDVNTGTVHLAYKYDIYATEPISRSEIYVDAHTGLILYKNPLIKHTNRSLSEKESVDIADKSNLLVAGNAETKYSGNRTIETTLAGSDYILKDNTRGNGIVTYNCEQTSNYQNVDFLDSDNNWTTAEYNNANQDIGALDAHWGAEKTYDFWQNIFGRNSFDDNGAQIKSYVHYRENIVEGYANAFWNGSVMTYGDGNNSVSILTSLDVCGHEIGHAICSYTANLAYRNQSGGINEGYSDIWGACIEHFGRTGSLAGTPVANVWKIAEDIAASPLRSMNDPLSQGNPDTYLGTNWAETADEGNCIPNQPNDLCGVHNNSGVMNHWFYILTEGKSGTNNAPIPDNYNVSGIGLAKAAEIAYLAERDYLTPNSTFFDLRNATLSVANDLYCPSSSEVIAVTNAWYAVNVGEEYVEHVTDVAVKSIAESTNVLCGTSSDITIKIENAGTGVTPISSADISYSIDGGSVSNVIWSGNLGYCQHEDFTIPLGVLARGTHSVSVSVNTIGDTNVSNNSKTVLVSANNQGALGLVNTFENATDALVSFDEGGTNNLWQRGTASGTILSNAVAGNSQVYGTVLSGLYPNLTKSYLVSQCYNLSNVVNPTLKFDMAFDLETSWDVLYMQYTTDGGNNWQPLGTGINTNWYTSDRLPDGNNCFNCIGGQWTGEGAMVNPNGGINAQKKQYSYNLSDFGMGGTSPQSDIIFRFVFQSDQAVQYDGVIIDNFTIDGTLATTDTSLESFTVWPNPSDGKVTLQITSTGPVNTALYDLEGRKVYAEIFHADGTMFNQELNFIGLEKGMYLLSVESEGKKAAKKLIIH